MFDLVEHLPIKNSKTSVPQLRAEIVGKLQARASKLGYQYPGRPRFRVVHLPLSKYLECRMDSGPLDLDQLIIDKCRGTI